MPTSQTGSLGGDPGQQPPQPGGEGLAGGRLGELGGEASLLNRRPGLHVGPSFFNVDTDACFEALAAIESVDADVVLPGHGDPWRDSPAAAVARARAVGRS